jgi:soluble lytic murein transglycosylase-like protein
MPATWREWGHGDPTDPYQAIIAQHKYMCWVESRAGAHLDPALAAYNWGIGNILKVQRRVKAVGIPGDRAWVRLCPAETQGYLLHNDYNRAVIQKKVSHDPNYQR